MSTILFILAVVVLIIVVMAHLPGLEHFVKPIIGLLFALVQAIAVNGFDWAFFVVKAVWFSHLDFLKNLTHSAESLDPTIEIKSNNNK
jgi:hypothetical protein